MARGEPCRLVDLGIGQADVGQPRAVHGGQTNDPRTHPRAPLDVAERAVHADAGDECYSRPLTIPVAGRTLGPTADEREDRGRDPGRVVGADHGRDVFDAHDVVSSARRAGAAGESGERRPFRLCQRGDRADGSSKIRGVCRRCFRGSPRYMCATRGNHRI